MKELLALPNDNAHRERRFYGASADKEIVKETTLMQIPGIGPKKAAGIRELVR
jgi:hypothetical protein